MSTSEPTRDNLVKHLSFTFPLPLPLVGVRHLFEYVATNLPGQIVYELTQQFSIGSIFSSEKNSQFVHFELRDIHGQILTRERGLHPFRVILHPRQHRSWAGIEFDSELYKHPQGIYSANIDEIRTSLAHCRAYFDQIRTSSGAVR